MLIDLDDLLQEISSKRASLIEAERTVVKTPQGKAAIWGAISALASIAEWAYQGVEEDNEGVMH